jgi:hypothetical protein
MNLVQMTHRGGLGHESPYALIERALNESPRSEGHLRRTAGASKLIPDSAGLVLIFLSPTALSRPTIQKQTIPPPSKWIRGPMRDECETTHIGPNHSLSLRNG